MNNKTNTKGLIFQIMFWMANDEIKITGFEVCKNITGKKRDRGFYNSIQKLKQYGLVESYSYFEEKEGFVRCYIRLTDIGRDVIGLGYPFLETILLTNETEVI